ncbi:MAG: hypothetical protein ACR2LQ_07320 [Acidimicrobiales bacterium]
MLREDDAPGGPTRAERVDPSLRAVEDRIVATIEHEVAELTSTVLELTRHVGALSERVEAMEANVSGDVLDALFQVAQHLEAVQAASSWALLNELSTRSVAEEGS